MIEGAKETTIANRESPPTFTTDANKLTTGKTTIEVATTSRMHSSQTEQKITKGKEIQNLLSWLWCIYSNLSKILYSFSLVPGILQICTFERMPLAAEKQYIGNPVADSFKASVDECIIKCNETINCNNFVYAKHKKECYLKDGILSGSEPVRSWDKQFSVYKSCKNGMHYLF